MKRPNIIAAVLVAALGAPFRPRKRTKTERSPDESVLRREAAEAKRAKKAAKRLAARDT